jgi:hypothetical protein
MATPAFSADMGRRWYFLSRKCRISGRYAVYGKKVPALPEVSLSSAPGYVDTGTLDGPVERRVLNA